MAMGLITDISQRYLPVNSSLTSALLTRWRDAAASGHADDDLAVVYLTA